MTLLDNNTFIFICLCLSVTRIYLEVIGFDFSKLPMTASLPPQTQQKFHKSGLYICVGYIVLFAPQVLFS
jgi:hypothetical protein